MLAAHLLPVTPRAKYLPRTPRLEWIELRACDANDTQELLISVYDAANDTHHEVRARYSYVDDVVELSDVDTQRSERDPVRLLVEGDRGIAYCAYHECERVREARL